MTKQKMLVQFDVDSTFIEQEAIDLLAAKAGVLAEVAQITNSAMNGEVLDGSTPKPANHPPGGTLLSPAFNFSLMVSSVS